MQETITQIWPSGVELELKEMPILNFVSNLLQIMGWNAVRSYPDGTAEELIYFRKCNGNLFFSVKAHPNSFECCLTGYNYAYQVKRVMDVFEEAGYFG